VRIALHIEAPGPYGILAGVVDPDAGALPDAFAWRQGAACDPEIRTAEVGAVLTTGHGESLAQLPWTAHERGQALHAAPLAHGLDASDRLQGAEEHGLGAARRLADDVEHVVDAVDEVHVGVTRGAEHDLVARGAAMPGMAGLVLGADVGLGLDDAPGKHAALDAATEDAAEELAGDAEGAAGVESAWQGRRSVRWHGRAPVQRRHAW